MTVISYSRNRDGRRVEYYSNTTFSSPKINGKLALRPQTHSFYHEWESGSTDTSNGLNISWPYTNGGYGTGPTPDLYNRAYSSFIKKLRSGSAELGMTLGTYAQTRDMITNRAGSALRAVDALSCAADRLGGKRPWRGNSSWEDKVYGLKRAYKRRGRDLGNLNLELQFGWTPFFQDVYATLNTVIPGAIPDEWVTGRGKGRIAYVDDWGSQYPDRIVTNVSGQVSCTLSARVQVSNPNIWLLNRLGLINPLTVAWDRVPWSWVVNMVVNVNELVGSLTDTVGLDISDVSVTRSFKLLGEYVHLSKSGQTFGYKRQNTVMKKKDRTLGGSVPRPHLEFKVPGANMFMAGIATSLLAQRVLKV